MDAVTQVDLAGVAARFGAVLHEVGVAVSPERSSRFASAVLLARPASVEDLYWLARVTLVDDVDQLGAFDGAFAQVFRGLVDVAEFRGDPGSPPVTPAPPPELRPGPDRRAQGPRGASSPAEVSLPALTGQPSGDVDQESETVLAAASSEERLRRKDFAACSPEELELLRRLVSQVRLAAPPRQGRRTSSRSSGRRLDLRRTLRMAHRTGGDPVRRRYRLRAERPRRVVLIADVSGSMEAYSRVYLHLLHGAVRGAGAEAFVFATRLTRLTRALAQGSPDVALADAMAKAPDWSGGTRIGLALKRFNDEYGRRGLARGAVVVIVSDGWERDDPALLGQQMARLSRLAHRIVWVNPRKAAEDFAPLAGGMAAALPHVDQLVSGHSLQSLDEVIAAIRGEA
ncbi:MAG TPA: VWA domain-containing protein [Actinomycetales bacterium]|nr:VWA domain-containing protein [Actinomycetales bacterium]